MNYNQLETEFKAVKNFLQAETSTIKGFKQYRSEVTYHLDEFESEEQESEFWQTYNKWIATHPKLAMKFKDTNQIQQMIYDNFVEQGKSARGTSMAVTRAINKMTGAVVEKKRREDILNEDALLNGVSQSDF